MNRLIQSCLDINRFPVRGPVHEILDVLRTGLFTNIVHGAAPEIVFLHQRFHERPCHSGMGQAFAGQEGLGEALDGLDETLFVGSVANRLGTDGAASSNCLNPLEQARLLALAGADLILHPSNLVTPYCQRSMFARSVENAVYIATVNRVGEESYEDGQVLSFSGGSQLLGPRGETLLAVRAEAVDVAAVLGDAESATSVVVARMTPIPQFPSAAVA